MTGHLKDNVFVLTALQGGLLPFLISDVLHVIALYHMVLHGIVLYLTVLHGIALLASAHGLYLARHLSTLLIKNVKIVNI